MKITPRSEILVSDLCAEIDELRLAVKAARKEADEWRLLHAQLVESQIKNNDRMIGGLVALAITRKS